MWPILVSYNGHIPTWTRLMLAFIKILSLDSDSTGINVQIQHGGEMA